MGLCRRERCHSVKHISAYTPGVSLKRHTLVVRSYVKEGMCKPYDIVRGAIIGYLPSGAAKPPFTTMCMHKPMAGDLKEEVSRPRPGRLTLVSVIGVRGYSSSI